MRILHTADWHVGKRLGRIDRSAEYASVLDEVVAVARDARVDATIVAGDLFDRALPPFESMGLVLDALARLADVAPVVAIPGNHDSHALFGVLAPYLHDSGIHLIDRIRRPGEGNVVTIPARAGDCEARIACMPFLHESATIDFLDPTEEWYKSYAERVRRITAAYADALAADASRDAVTILTGHFMVDGAVPSGSERPLHIGEAFMARSAAIPPGVRYAALGHIHLTQQAPGTDHGWYAGSLMQLDFGERGQDKNVLVVEVTPQRPGARVTPVAITSGRRLRDVTGTLDELRAQADSFGDDILRVTVPTDGPRPGLADEVRSLLPNALYVRAEYERHGEVRTSESGRPLHELYRDYCLAQHGVAPSAELLEAFVDLCTGAGVET